MAGGAFISRGKPSPVPCDPFKKNQCHRYLSFNNNTNLFLFPVFGRTCSIFQSQKNTNTVVLDTGSWCRVMWNSSATNTLHLMEGREMKCWGCLNLDLLILTVNTWFYTVIKSYSDTNAEFYNLCGYLFNKTQTFSALFWNFFFIFQLGSIKRCLKVGLSMLMHSPNSLFFHSI